MLVSRITRALGDAANDLEPGNEHVRWPLPFLYEYIYEALEQIKALEPKLFSTLKRLQLQPGSTQMLSVNDAEILDILDITQADHKLLKFFNKNVYCGVNQDYKPTSFSIDDSNSRIFYITPPVPDYPPVFINVFVAQAIQPIVAQAQSIVFPGGDIDRYFSPILDWALFRMWSKDTESTSSQRLASVAYKSFYDFFNVKKTMESAEKAEKAAKGEEF